ncbi:Hypothetical_protein [Hexamita inflata]|uniref:Hypothetical_protein n=1 Tax=Hexamita inflata TaxID=28002 RepID=A0AA86RF21_9EUKA|nr:Hypothetical protein HINF_LOCUS20182 [Hexamita inflata]CAI9965975.1 Hypothetical protein HINF_LOCUS53620 [Hexamita inflata]
MYVRINLIESCQFRRLMSYLLQQFERDINDICCVFDIQSMFLKSMSHCSNVFGVDQKVYYYMDLQPFQKKKILKQVRKLKKQRKSRNIEEENPNFKSHQQKNAKDYQKAIVH